MNALIVVDVQKDFLPGGALPVPEGEAILPVIVDIARDFDVIVASQDWHPLSHVSFKDPAGYHDKSWPAHCVQHTEGAKLHPDIRHLTNYRCLKGVDPEEEAYSAFHGNVFNDRDKDRDDLGSLNYWLRDQAVTSVTVVGLALDYCVKHTAIDAVNAGFATSVPLAATRAFNEETGVGAIIDLDNAGVKVVRNVDLLW